MLEYSFTKAKLPKGRSYPLKQSILDKFIFSVEEAPYIWMVRYMIGTGETCTVLGATYYGKYGRSGSSDKVSIDVYSVQSFQRKMVESLIIDNAFPILKRWLCEIARKNETWKDITHSVFFNAENDSLILSTR